MITAVDTSVLIAIAKAETDAEKWTDRLVEAQNEGDLVICDVVAAEYFAVLMDQEKFQESLSRLGIAFSPTSLKSAQLAGRLFRKSRSDRLESNDCVRTGHSIHWLHELEARVGPTPCIAA